MPVLTADIVPMVLGTGRSAVLDLPISPRFQPGDTVVARNINPVTHTRLPRYVRGKRGTVEVDHGVFSFPDTGAHGQKDRPQHVYSVRFAARELWGDQASPRDVLNIDLFEEYMEPAPGTGP
jgi:nitrile hydratase